MHACSARRRWRMSDFLKLQGKTILVLGVANKKSVAWQAARVLKEAGADLVYSVRSEARRESVRKLVGDAPVLVCDVEDQTQIDRLRDEVAKIRPKLHGMLHSIAFADYAGETNADAGLKPFHETSKAAFLRAVDISCFSLIALSNAMRGLFDSDASVVTVSISTTRMAAENYGFMAPVKAALDSSLAFLAKSFTRVFARAFHAVAGVVEDFGVGGDSRLCRCVFVRRAGDVAQTGGANGGSREHRGVFVEPGFEWDQRAADCCGCGDECELF